MDYHLVKIKEAIIKGGHKEIQALIESALGDNVNPDKIVNEAMISGMDVVGQKFSQNEIFVPEMLVSAVTMNKGLDILKPLLQAGSAESKGTIIMCTVKGDIHDIGKNLVVMMLEGAGFKVINLGVDLSVEKLVEKVKEQKPDILGLSALLTTTMPEMQKVIESLEINDLRNDLKVMVGGAPVDSVFAEKIGADSYGKDAVEAVQIARAFLTESTITRETGGLNFRP
jgi:5-methyltetrahydrofolate--homocysteine methyltransferase